MKAPATATPKKTTMLPAAGATAARPYCDIAYGTWTTWCAGRSSCPSSLRLASASSREVKAPWRTTSADASPGCAARRSEEHTSELQSQSNLVCRLLLEKKKKKLDTRSCP